MADLSVQPLNDTRQISVGAPPPPPALSLAKPTQQMPLSVQQAQPQQNLQVASAPPTAKITGIGTADNIQPYTPKLSFDEFAQKIKAQYPQYQSVDNTALTQKILDKYPQYKDKVDLPQAQTATPPTKQKGFWGQVGDDIWNGGGGFNPVRELVGIAKGVGQTITGIEHTGQKALETITDPIVKAITGAPVEHTKTAKEQFGEALKEKGVGENIGGLLEKTAEIVLPGGVVTKAQAGLEGLSAVQKLNQLQEWGRAGKALSTVAQSVIRAIPEVGLGTTWALSQGEDPKQALKTGAEFGAFSVAGEAVGGIARKVVGNIAQNVQKALGMTGAMNATQAIEKTPKAIRALKFISNMAPDIKVLDDAGVEKTFDPAKATFYETMQAWTKARDMAYHGYTDLAKAAGDKGAVFKGSDFNQVIADVRASVKDSTSAFKTKAESLIKDLQDNFGASGTKDLSKKLASGKAFEPTDLQRMQDFVQKVNIDINPLSDKAGSEVSATLSQSIRKILDDKISQTTGEGYQALRTNYGDLKSIEKDLVNQFKKAARGNKGFGSYIEGYGALDVIVAAISHNPIEAAKGGLLAGLGALMKRLRDPEVNLQRAFKQLSDKPQGEGITRAFGRAVPPPTTPSVSLPTQQ